MVFDDKLLIIGIKIRFKVNSLIDYRFEIIKSCTNNTEISLINTKQFYHSFLSLTSNFINSVFKEIFNSFSSPQELHVWIQF